MVSQIHLNLFDSYPFESFVLHTTIFKVIEPTMNVECMYGLFVVGEGGITKDPTFFIPPL